MQHLLEVQTRTHADTHVRAARPSLGPSWIHVSGIFLEMCRDVSTHRQMSSLYA